MNKRPKVQAWLMLVCLLAAYVCAFRVVDVARRSSRLTVSMSSSSSNLPAAPTADAKTNFGLGKFAFSLLPLSPESVGRRKTLLTEVVKDTIYTLDQVQGIINVNVPVRATAIALKNGGLFINNPVAPTAECIDMVRSLEAKHGAVKIIVLSSLGIEHKGTCGIFSSFFPSAQVYIQPGQYAFPVNLPTAFFFPAFKKLKDIPASNADAAWKDDLDHVSLGVLKPKGPGGFAETAFFHRATGTLLVTDAVVKVEDEPPAIINEDPRALLYHARDDMFQVVRDSPANRRKGWRRMVLFGLTFQPAGIKILPTLDALKKTKDVPLEMKALGEGAIPLDPGFYPWEWVKDDMPSFKKLQGGLLVAPILQKLILNREPQKVLDWADKVAKWPIKRIIPCHLANDIKASGKDFRRAFNFLEDLDAKRPFWKARPVPAPVGDVDDVKLLSDVSIALTKQDVLFPEGAKIKLRV